ncbi:MAG: MMPL family transporter [Candidatus Thermoplasmatota archaeon]|nr:MMPL family transporter [Candidatus Thermoplasmatota archaeon]
MIFEKLANTVVRHHKLIIVIWIVALLYIAPAITKVNDVLVYQESEMVEGDIESLIAQKIIDEQFPTSLANSTLMIVLQGQDVGSAEVRDFCLELEDQATAPGRLAYLEDFSSVYSAYQGMVYTLAAELGPALVETEYEVNMTASLLYGIPSIYLGSWLSTDPVLSIPERDYVAYQTTMASMPYLLADADEASRQLSYQYLEEFCYAWNLTYNDPGLTSNPQARAETAIGVAAPQFIESLPYPDDQKAVMYAVLASFGLSSFSNQSLLHGFSVSTVAAFASVSDLVFMEEVYALGPEYTPTELAVFSRTVVSTRTLSELPAQLPPEYLSSLVSPDGTTTLIILSFSKDSGYVEGGRKLIVDNVFVLREMVSELKSVHLSSDYRTYVTGDSALTADMEESMMDELALIEPVTIVIIIVLMGIFFRSVVAQFLPLGGVMVALGFSQALVFFVGSVVADIHYSVITLLFSILMGVGTDYAIFIVARYREERIKGHNREESVRTSVTWAGESISTSGATVMISFFALSVAEFSMIRTMGMILGLAIAISLLVALTLVPSIIMLLGNRIFWPTRGARWYRFAKKVMEKRSQGHRGYFYKAANFSIRHSKTVIVVALLISIPTTYVFLNAETSFDFIGGMASGVESNEGIVAMSEAFGAGRIMPTEVVVVFDTPVYSEGNFSMDNLGSIDDVAAVLAATENVKQVTGPTNPRGDHIDYVNLSAMSPELRASYEATMLQLVGVDGRTALFTVILEEGPMTPESLDTVRVIRDELAALKASDGAISSAGVYVGGSSAIIYDLKIDLDQQFTTMRIIVVIGIFVVLLIVLGALLLSLFAILSIMLSITWAFAATVGLFGYVLGEPILWIVPLILFIMLMGIGMDYNVFILTRIREEIHKGKSDKEAIVDSLDWTGGIITALAVIMGSAFSMMMISGTMMLKEIGFALAFAILLDAMLVRTYIVPAMMTVLGKWGWWAPGPLQRERRETK